MYDELIERLRETSVDFGESDHISVMMIEAANAIEELQQITTHYEEESKGWWLAACDAKEERERLKEQIPKWIPVTERLPEEGEFVLVYGDLYPNKHDGGVIAVSKRMDWNYWQGFGRKKNITHWMPIPQPPKDSET